MKHNEAKEVAVGSVWYVWGQHQEVVMERPANSILSVERQVRLNPLDSQGERIPTRFMPWVEAWRVQKHGEPSVAFSKAPA